MNRSLKVITQGVNWRDGQAVLHQFMETLLVGFAQEMERQLQGDWMGKQMPSWGVIVMRGGPLVAGARAKGSANGAGHTRAVPSAATDIDHAACKRQWAH